jgi:iron(III) transport system ATP-binding protein
MTVEENIAYPLRMRGASKDVQRSTVRRVLDMMRIADIAGQHPGQISGGQQQRVALARALACGDELILFDEPLSNVDAKVREHLRLELLRMQRELGFTALYVTHDQEEAMALATKIAVLGNGRIAQLGTPQDIYFRPLSLYVGRFIGSANQIDGHLTRQSDFALIDTPLGRVKVPTGSVAAKGEQVTVLSRPEHWFLTGEPSRSDLCFEAKVRAAAFVGSHNEYLVEVNGVELQVWTLGQQLLQAGASMWCSISAESLLVLDRG